MATDVELPNFEQVLAIGRGVEPDGRVLYDSPVSGDSYDRGFRLGQYAARNRGGLRRIIISGGYTFALEATGSLPAGSEAHGIHVVGLNHGMPEDIETIEDEASLTTYSNFLNTVQYFSPGETAGLVVHKDHAARALKVGKHVMPEVTFVPIYADNSNRLHANRGVGAKDKVAALLYAGAMLGVEAGDLDRIRSQDERVQRMVLAMLRLRGGKPAGGLSKDSLPA